MPRNVFKAALHRAIQTERKASNTLARAQAEFYKDMSNSDAANAVVAAHQSLMEASIVRKDAEQAFQSSQQALTSALKNLDGAQQLDRASVNAKAQQSYDEFLRKRAEARNNEQAGGQAGEPETVSPDQTTPYNVSNERKEGNPLAPGNERDIMGEGKQGEDASRAGDAGKADEQTAVGAGGALDHANYAQKTYNRSFSNIGQKIYSELAGKQIKTVDDLANALQNGFIKPEDIPIDYIVRDGNILVLNTRSSQALTQAGIPRNQWKAFNRTGNFLFEEMLTEQLKNNKFTSTGIPTVRLGGGVK